MKITFTAGLSSHRGPDGIGYIEKMERQMNISDCGNKCFFQGCKNSPERVLKKDIGLNSFYEVSVCSDPGHAIWAEQELCRMVGVRPLVQASLREYFDWLRGADDTMSAFEAWIRWHYGGENGAQLVDAYVQHRRERYR